MKRGAWGILGALSAAGVVAWLGRRQLGHGLGATREDVGERTWAAIGPEFDDAQARAHAAGARGDLKYIGAGASGIVFCDDKAAYKVGRSGRGTLQDEADWLAIASQVPGVKEHVARRPRYDAKHDVIVRECVRGPVGTWKDSRKLHAIHEAIEQGLRPYGYGRPEFKEDSYVLARGRGPVLVDASMGILRGKALVRHVVDILGGRRLRKPHEKNEDLAWEVRMESGSTIPKAIADRLLQRLGVPPE